MNKHGSNNWWKNYTKKLLVSEKELSDINFEKLKKKVLMRIKNSFTDSDNNFFLTVDSLIDINNIMTSSNNMTLKKVFVKFYGYDKMYMNKDSLENKWYQLIDQFDERKKLVIKVFTQNWLETYIHVMMEIRTNKILFYLHLKLGFFRKGWHILTSFVV